MFENTYNADAEFIADLIELSEVTINPYHDDDYAVYQHNSLVAWSVKLNDRSERIRESLREIYAIQCEIAQTEDELVYRESFQHMIEVLENDVRAFIARNAMRAIVFTLMSIPPVVAIAHAVAVIAH